MLRISKAATYDTVKSVVEQIDFVGQPGRLRSAQECREYPKRRFPPSVLPESSLGEPVCLPVYLKADSLRRAQSGERLTARAGRAQAGR